MLIEGRLYFTFIPFEKFRIKVGFFQVLHDVVYFRLIRDPFIAYFMSKSHAHHIKSLHKSFCGIKHNPDEILQIAVDQSGRIVFLETGNLRAGLAHVVSRHADDFARVGIAESQIPDLLIAATTRGRVGGMQGAGAGRPIYEVFFDGRTVRVAVTVGDNGFIVGANPVGR